MADISKITPPGSQTTYNLKDSTARTATQWLDKLNGSKNLLSVYTFERASMYADVQSDGCTVRVHGTGSGVDLTYGTFTVPETGEYSALISIKSGTVTSLYLKPTSTDSFDLKNVITPTSMGTLTQGTVYELKTWTATGATVDFTVSILICKTGVLESGLTDFRPPALSNSALTQGVIWNTNNGVKNLLTYGCLRSGQTSGATFTINNDGSITVNTNGTLANDAYMIFNLSNGTPSAVTDVFVDKYCNGEFVLSGCPTGGGLDTYSMYAAKGSYTKYDFGSGVILTPTSETNILLVVMVKAGQNKSNLVFRPMIRPAFVEDDTYEPYALPNTKITPELIDLVDSGAKNCLPQFNTNFTPTANVSYSYDADHWIDVDITGTVSAYTQMNLFGGYISNKFAGKNLYFNISNNPSNVHAKIVYSSNGSTAAYSVETVTNGYTITGDYPYIGIFIVVDSGATRDFKFKAMICTKAAWDVSQKFVPYRPTYEETVEQVAENKNNISTVYGGMVRKNRLNYDLSTLKSLNTSSTWSGTTGTTNRGQTIAYNPTDNSLTVNGNSSTETAYFNLNTTVTLPAGTYRLYGCPEGGSSSTYELQAVVGGTDYHDYGSGVGFALSAETTIGIVLTLRGGNYTNIKFTPILCTIADYDADITHAYQPYIMNNDEISAAIRQMIANQ